jgi:uncharacterized membrane-anchored protein
MTPRNEAVTTSQRRLSYAIVPSSGVTETTRSEAVKTQRVLLSKVPDVTGWFWIIKILCTTVGESFADWINTTLGLGLHATALIFTAVLAAVLGLQLRLNRYVPIVYWLTVVVFSVTGTLYTDIVTDDLGVPLAVSTSVFAAALAAVFGVWFARERTLSIHSIVTVCSIGSRFWSPLPWVPRLVTGRCRLPAGGRVCQYCCRPP